VLSVALRRFIRRNISSVEQLEILLLLFADSLRRWSVSEISLRLRSSEASVAKRLGDLEKRRLAVRDEQGSFSYRSDPRTDARMIELRDQYSVRQARIIDFIFSEPSDALSSFAEAFRLKEDDRDR
jgi:hypothetical protein